MIRECKICKYSTKTQTNVQCRRCQILYPRLALPFKSIQKEGWRFHIVRSPPGEETPFNIDIENPSKPKRWEKECQIQWSPHNTPHQKRWRIYCTQARIPPSGENIKRNREKSSNKEAVDCRMIQSFRAVHSDRAQSSPDN